MSRVCAFNGISIHNCMLGHILDFDPNITIFTGFEEYDNCKIFNHKWIEYYLKIFPNAKFINYQIFNEDDWDRIFLLTDDDPHIFRDNSKVICIDHHWKTSRRTGVDKRLSIRYYRCRPDDKWIIPNFDIKFEKCVKPTINVAYIGRYASEDLKLEYMFENFKEINFHLFSIIKPSYDIKYENIHYYYDATTEKMINCLKFCDYVLVSEPIKMLNSASGSILLAYTTHCRLLFPKGWKDEYKLETPLEINFGEKLVKPTSEDIEAVKDEARSLITYRNNLYRSLLRNSWFHKTLGELCPNIIVETGTYLGHGVRSYIGNFDTIYSIELSDEYYKLNAEQFKDYPNIHIIHGDSSRVLANLELKLEPILFYLDAHFSGGKTAGSDIDNGCPVLRELEIISKRNVAGDIIVIDDMRLMGIASWAGVDGCSIYPKTFYDFSHANQENILKALCGRNLKHSYMAQDIDRLILVLN